MTEVEEVEDMKGKEDMTGIEIMTGVENMTGIEDMTGIKGMKNDIRKERRDHCKAGYMRLNWVGNIKAREN